MVYLTMRCKNCGWPNKPNETVCVKCGSSLESEPQVAVTYSNGGDDHTQSQVEGGDGLKKTVMESQVFGPSVESPVLEAPTVSETVCPKCGYPMRSDALKCPNCNYDVSSSSNVKSQTGYQRRPTRMAIEPAPEVEELVLKKTRKATESGGFSGTINPYMMNYQAEPAFVLEPIQRMNERKPVMPVEFEGHEVLLTRDNTEAGNPTISSKEQATMSFSDGHWSIEDLSDQKTTFVQANHKIELHDGDIILLGNRLFKFKEQ